LPASLDPEALAEAFVSKLRRAAGVFFEADKNTSEMIRMMEILLDRYGSRRQEIAKSHGMPEINGC
jgi:hypothetical protein